MKRHSKSPGKLVEEKAYAALGPHVDVEHNEEAGTFVVAEWHGDDAPCYVIPEAVSDKFLRWLGRERRAHIKAAQRELNRLTTRKDRKRIKAAYAAWDAENPSAAAS